MKRRAFLEVLAVTALPVAGISLGPPGDAHIRLYDGNKPVTDPLPTRFRWNSKMSVTIQPSETIRVTKAVLYSSEVGQKVEEFDVIVVTPETEITLVWTITRGKSA